MCIGTSLSLILRSARYKYLTLCVGHIAVKTSIWRPFDCKYPFLFLFNFHVYVVSIGIWVLIYGMGSNHVHQLQGIQDCFRVLPENREISHTWTGLNVASWELEEVFLNPIQYDGCIDLFSWFVYFLGYRMCWLPIFLETVFHVAFLPLNLLNCVPETISPLALHRWIYFVLLLSHLFIFFYHINKIHVYDYINQTCYLYRMIWWSFE
jgi:hypothetical protein